MAVGNEAAETAVLHAAAREYQAATGAFYVADKLNADRMLETAERLGTFVGMIDRAAATASNELVSCRIM